MIKSGSYLAVRHRIQNGDVVFVRNGGGWFAKLVRFVTGRPHWHVGVAVWMTDSFGHKRLMMIEGYLGGRRLVNMSAYAHHDLDVLMSPVPSNLILDGLLADTGVQPYGYLDLLAIAVRERLGLTAKDYPGEVCSEMVAKALNGTRGYGFALTPVPSPGLLYDELVNDYRIVVRCRIRK